VVSLYIVDSDICAIAGFEMHSQHLGPTWNYAAVLLRMMGALLGARRRPSSRADKNNEL
jgi:hypothetical protein